MQARSLYCVEFHWGGGYDALKYLLIVLGRGRIRLLAAKMVQNGTFVVFRDIIGWQNLDVPKIREKNA